MKTNYKQLKATLALGVRKLGLASVMSKLGEFPLLDGFLDLADFLLFEFPDLNNFPVFDNFPHFSINSSPPSTPPTSSTANISSATSTYDNRVVFTIDVSGAAILLKP